ncbi:DNA-directed RNA polymerase [Gnomoniopsis smithogilvyi]|uniref:DNA-directed RNA polymerase n=1 Tax=Gnomoniopsis smithogilvyi TaxID=1191159 RepID=A0A9W8YJ96_9PEZI|nr:DNA-directed RNA polymerase [Gnomoniopsis smithogilvyi]
MTSAQPEFKLYNIRAIDPLASPDLLTTIDEPKRVPPKSRRTTYAVPGEVDVAMPVFEACVRVGKLERAAVVLKRLEAMPGVEPEELMYMNNLYLEAWVKQLKANPGVGKAEDLHAWYEVHVHSAGLPQTPETIAYMLKASLLTTATDGTRLTRLINRYMDMVPPDQGLDVLYCTDILTDLDIAAITKLYPEFNVRAFDGDEGDESAVFESVATENTASTSTQTPVEDDGSTIPRVLETPQKGSGLLTIQSTLDLFKSMRDGNDISKLPPSVRREFQARLERDCIDAAMERWREMDESLRSMGMNTFMNTAGMSSRLWVWHQDLEAWLKREFDLITEAEAAVKKSEEDAERCAYGPILLQSTPARLAAITTLAVLNSIAFQGADKGVALSVIINAISRAAEEDIQARKIEENRKAEMRKGKANWIREKQRQGQVQTDNQNQEHVPSEGNEVPRLATVDSGKQERLRTWPLSLRTKISAVLLSGLTETAKVRVVREHAETKEKVVSMQPAFTHCHQYRRGRKIGVLMAHPVLSESMRKEPKADFLARHLPMVVTPEPWSKFDEGAYLESPVPLVRIKSGEQDQKLYAEAALARGDMEQVVKGLDVLGKTAWRINRKVFDVLLDAWNTGEAIAKVPPLNPDIPVPQEPDASEGPLARRLWTKALKQAHNTKMGYHSVRCYMNFQLEIARAFRDQEFFFPHNVDFRGRAYPIPTYLNHMGADHVRGLLRFSKGRELGERGLMWLKVHLANVYGFDKASLKDREAFATENLPNIINSAENPLKGDRWWLDAEDPWQCLAACFELKAAMDLPDPTKFVSSLPVHQDGTCNGLQHYAALGGDTWGAQQVNLLPADKPADVYSAVADLVRQGVDEDAKLGNPVAKAMTDKIKRKIVKQTVMTNVYGVTFSGAKKQVLKQIVAHYPNIEKETGVAPGLVASYIATRIFKALATMFKGAHDIQYWLGEIGSRVCRALTAEQLNQVVATDVEPASGSTKAKRIVSKDDLLELCRSTIIWTTPLRMPVVQPYRKNQSKVIHTCMQTFILQNPNRMDPVNRRKQLQAFPPNFIHSLDASHMLLSALECDDKGLSFAAVHDSFWTHAADVDVMNGVLRDAFIRIHSEDVIKRLAAEFEARYKGGLYMAQIDRRSEAGKAILQWRLTRKRTLNGRDEIVMEKQRIDLLASSDPLEQQKGREMVTPASLYEKLAPNSDAAIVPEDLSGTALGSLDGGASSVEEDDDAEGAVADEGAEDSDTARKSSNGRSKEDDDMSLAAEEDNEAMDEAAAAHQSELDIISTYTNKGSFQTMLEPPPKKAPKKSYSSPVSVWLPLSFPKVPTKGDFDVKKLRGSDYFFS